MSPSLLHKACSAALILLLPLLAASCGIFTPHPPRKYYDKMAVVPDTFLFTKYEPLNEWLDTPVKFQVFDCPLLDIFQDPALRSLRIQVIQAPKENPKITIDRIAITRRQLLWSLAQDHQLNMTPVFGGSAAESRIEVRARD